MISTRKRKIMLQRIHAYFENLGKFLTEQEYKADPSVPIRYALITKYLGGYHRLRYYLSFYYPQWAVEEKVQEPVQEPVQEAPKKDPFEALKAKDDVDE